MSVPGAIIDALTILTPVRYLRFDDEENVSYMVLLSLRKRITNEKGKFSMYIVPKLWCSMDLQILFTEIGNSLDKGSICYPKSYFSMASHEESQFHSSKFTMKV